MVPEVSFESEIVIKQKRREKDLTNTEERALTDLQEGSACEEAEDVGPKSIVQCAFKRLKNDPKPTCSVYEDRWYLLPTCHIWGRPFTVPGHALLNSRRGTLPSSFERQLFSYINVDHFDVSNVKAIVQNNNDNGQIFSWVQMFFIFSWLV